MLHGSQKIPNNFESKRIFTETIAAEGAFKHMDVMCQEYLWDPFQQVDKGSSKHDPRYPDFKHEQSKEGLQATLDAMTQPSGCEYSSSQGYRRYPEDVSQLCKGGHLKEALIRLDSLGELGIRVSTNSYVCVLQECIKRKALRQGRHVHAQMIKSGLDLNIPLGRSLVRLYATCGQPALAHEVFCQMPEEDLFALTGLLKGYVDNGRAAEALKVFYGVQRSCKVDKFVYAIIINACASLSSLVEGRRAHARMFEDGVKADVLVDNLLLAMYVKCGSILDAQKHFERMAQRDVISWNTMISGHIQHGGGVDALCLFQEMLRIGQPPDVVTFICAANACSTIRDLGKSKLVHEYIRKAGTIHCASLSNALVHMYARCGSLQDALEVFNGMSQRDVVSWNAIIQGHAEQGLVEESFQLLKQMCSCGLKPNVVTFLSMLRVCTNRAVLEECKQLHDLVIRSGLESDVFVGNSILDMYSKCGSLQDARQAFDGMSAKNVVSWTTMVGAYAHAGLGEEALDLYELMQLKSVEPNKVTFVCALKACATARALDMGRRIHKDIINCRVAFDVVLETALVDMYGKCGVIDEAHLIFDNMSCRSVATWNAMIASCAQSGHEETALNIFQKMQREAVKPDVVTFVSVLNACSGLAALKDGQQVHAYMIRCGEELDNIVQNALVDMYTKCGSLDSAQQVFDNMHVRDVVSWNALIKGYAQHGYGDRAMNLFKQMQQEGVKPDLVTFAAVLNGCASMGALAQGRWIHTLITRSGLSGETFVENALIDMYSKCGSIDDAREVFCRMTKRDPVSWSTMIAGYAQHGCSNHSLILFEELLQEGVPVDHITFVGVLSACSRVGLIERGVKYFKSMYTDHGITPTDAHYACLVDLLGRAGQLDEAFEAVKGMRFQPSVMVWTSLLAACRIHRDIELAEEAAKQIIALEPQNAAAFVLLANTYAAAGRRDDQLRVRQMMRDSGVKKQPGRSWISVENHVHLFNAEDLSHPQRDEIYAMVQQLNIQISEHGCA